MFVAAPFKNVPTLRRPTVKSSDQLELLSHFTEGSLSTCGRETTKSNSTVA